MATYTVITTSERLDLIARGQQRHAITTADGHAFITPHPTDWMMICDRESNRDRRKWTAEIPAVVTHIHACEWMPLQAVPDDYLATPREEFAAYWDSVHESPNTWDDNPTVAVFEITPCPVCQQTVGQAPWPTMQSVEEQPTCTRKQQTFPCSVGFSLVPMVRLRDGRTCWAWCPPDDDNGDPWWPPADEITTTKVIDLEGSEPEEPEP